MTEHRRHHSIDIRLRYLAGRLHCLGPRALYEFITEIQRNPGGDVMLCLERYAAIDLDHLRAAGGDQFPTQIFEVRK